MSPSKLRSIVKQLRQIAEAIESLAEATMTSENMLPAIESIHSVGFSVRARKILSRAKIETISDLAEVSAEDLGFMQNCGETTVEEVRQKLAEFGLSLRGE